MPGRGPRLGALVLAIVSLAFPWLVMDRLPADIPVSWTWGGEVAAHASRPLGALLMPLLTLLVYGLLASLPRISPREFAHPPLALIHAQTELAIVGFMAFMSVLILMLAAGVSVGAGRAALGTAGLLAVGLGLCLPALGRRLWRKTRAAWPQAYLNIWSDAHALAARLLVFAGALVSVLAALGASLMPAMVLVPASLFLPLIPAFIAAWKLESARQQAGPPQGPLAGSGF